MTDASADAAGRSVAGKVMAVLGAFSPAQPELTLNELANVTGLPLSTAYRLASQLVESEGLEHVPGGGYRVGARIWEIGWLASRTRDLREIVGPFMEALYEATNETVQLAVLQGVEAVVIDQVGARRRAPSPARLANRVPLYPTAAGKALLAYAPPDVLAAVLQAGLHRYTQHTIVAPGRLLQALSEVRRTGLAFAREELAAATFGVASPIFDANGSAVAALAIVVSPAHIALQDLAPAVRTAALCCARQLGYPALASNAQVVPVAGDPY